MPGRTAKGKTPYRFVGKASDYLFTQGKPPPPGHKILPCKTCMGCRLEKSRQWAMRLLHETRFHENNIFVTLTYSDQHLPKGHTLDKYHFSTFIKDLRSRLDYHYDAEKIKYFGSGEYADPKEETPTGRPHYHAILFGTPFGVDPIDWDEERHEEEPTRSGHKQFSHDCLNAVWDYGRITYSEVNFETAAYVARYVLKKITGADAKNHYGDRLPEFQRTSNGLGRDHVQQFLDDIYPSDKIVLPERGECSPPDYYDRILEKVDPSLFLKVKEAREAAQTPIHSSEFKKEMIERYKRGLARKLITERTLKRGL